jgi:crotonobetainyl-CoA:carnitine CoA-transferase CaiB-like acyl-CoA transferase
VRTLVEVVNDPHLHERGSLQWIDHPEYGRIVVPTTPLRFGGEDAAVPYRPSAGLGADTAAILKSVFPSTRSRSRNCAPSKCCEERVVRFQTACLPPSAGSVIPLT